MPFKYTKDSKLISVFFAPLAFFALCNGTLAECLVSGKVSYPGSHRVAVQAVHCIYLDYGKWHPLQLHDAACSTQHSALTIENTQSMFYLSSEHTQYKETINVLVKHMITAQM